MIVACQHLGLGRLGCFGLAAPESLTILDPHAESSICREASLLAAAAL
jgi:hypothetical protein